LITLPVERLLLAIQIGWERHSPVLFEDLIYRPFGIKTDNATSSWDPLLDHETQIV
jgi:hypothetical protein